MVSRFRLSLAVLVGLVVVGPFACSQSANRPGFGPESVDEAGDPVLEAPPPAGGFGPSSDAGPRRFG